MHFTGAKYTPKYSIAHLQSFVFLLMAVNHKHPSGCGALLSILKVRKRANISGIDTIKYHIPDPRHHTGQ